jgi:PAS domain S-box-containing protein
MAKFLPIDTNVDVYQQLLYEQPNLIIIEFDLKFCVTNCNVIAENALAKKRGELLGKDLSAERVNGHKFSFIKKDPNAGFVILDNAYNSIKWRLLPNEKQAGWILLGELGREPLPENSFYSYLNDVLKKVPGSVYWKDLDGRFLGCNQFVADMAGLLSPEDVIGKTDYELCWKDKADIYRKNDEDIIKSGREMVITEQVKLANGSTVFLLSTKSPLRDNEGKIIGIIGTSIDITELTETQNKLTSALKKVKLSEKSKKMLVEKIMAELRTPLHSISMAAQLLLKIDHNPSREEYYNLIHSASMSIEKILGQFLSYLTLESPERGSLVGQDVRVLLEDLIVKQHYAGAMLRKNDLLLHYNWDLPQGLGFYPEPVKEVLDLLISNAVRFTFGGCILVKVWLEFAPNNNHRSYLWFSVADTGDGIPKNKHKDLFSFYEDEEGVAGIAGFALSRAHRTIIQGGGTLQFTSEVGAGSCFSFKVPVSIPPLEYATPKEKIDFSNYNFLIIDSIDMRGEAIARMLPEGTAEYVNCSNFKNVRERLGLYNFFIIDESIPESVVQMLLQELKVVPNKEEISIYLLGTKETLALYPIFQQSKTPVFLIKKPLLGTHFIRQLQPLASVLVIEDNLLNLHLMKLFFQQLGVRIDCAPTLKEAKEKLETGIHHYYFIFSDIYLPDGSTKELPEYVRKLCRSIGRKTVRVAAITAHASQNEVDQYEQAGFVKVLAKPIRIEDLQKILKRELPHELWRNPFPDEED